MFIAFNSHQRAFSALFFVSLQVSVGLITSMQPVLAQALPSVEPSPVEFPTPPASIQEVSPSAKEESSALFDRYFLDVGDSISVVVQRPPGPYRLGIGDTISVTVQRFPDLSFQATINLEGNIVVPLLGVISLRGLSLPEAKAKIRSSLNRYVIEPDILLSLAGERPNLSFSALIGQDGNILVPQVGQLFIKGLSLEAAQEKIASALSSITTDTVAVSLSQPRPAQITITGEVFRPGIYAAGAGTARITDILPLAGGTTLTADLREIQVRRQLNDGSIVSQNINLYASLQNGGLLPKLRLRDGDAIIVPRRELGTDDGYDRKLVARSNLVVPQIKVRILNYTAGGIITQSLPSGSTFIDILGGVSLSTANLRDIALVRFDPEQGKAVTQRLDGKKVLAGDVSQNVALQDNDVIVVGRNLIGKLQNLLTTITQPYFNVQSFLQFFQNFGNGLFGSGSNSNSN
ncbi:polysaccharide biosynthesis/export family protein [Sphaerospermopsis aphanizomenoides BCCUSP55]|uniref:polysaccharide biosynthesis/export family protein n=1 Tax=Sphaerospermopsis aphanizomenoides TaxID=459663 RepID=UPI0019061A1F|nr:polysaccharide biosynthesis/export family protein [Sphaerospermopsis aphanizomenoides]MBK1990453.1 polysaccharide biosynthesis/export family protein [Sphaerospermopsis aphanizomenoides BCCUSP55]